MQQLCHVTPFSAVFHVSCWRCGFYCGELTTLL